MNPELLFWCFIVVGTLGFVSFLVLLFANRWSIEKLNGFGELPKIAIEIIQAISGIVAAIVGIYGAFAVAADKGEWFRPAIAGAVTVGLWKLVQLVVDHRQKQQSNRSRISSGVMDGLRFGIRSMVVKKLDRVQSAVGSMIKQPTIQDVRKTFTPDTQIKNLLDQLAIIIRDGFVTGHPNANLRIGVYVNVDGFMRPVSGISLKNPGYPAFQLIQKV